MGLLRVAVVETCLTCLDPASSAHPPPTPAPCREKSATREAHDLLHTALASAAVARACSTAVQVEAGSGLAAHEQDPPCGSEPTCSHATGTGEWGSG